MNNTNFKKVCDRLQFRIKETEQNKIFLSRKVTSIKQLAQSIIVKTESE